MMVICSSSLKCRHLSRKIRFEALKRQRGREITKHAAKLIYINIYDSGYSWLMTL
jgi:hypothetical protein